MFFDKLSISHIFLFVNSFFGKIYRILKNLFVIDICHKICYYKKAKDVTVMPRPQKKRYVCRLPEISEFSPKENPCGEKVVMTVDEYESIRLIDYEGGMQEECAMQMNVARTTVQGIYNSARKKLADAVVNGKKLVIEGGDYVLCECYTKSCGKGCGCKKYCHRRKCINSLQKGNGNNENSGNL